MIEVVPFTCDVCGGRNWPELIPAVGDVLRCPNCGDERPFVRPPLLIITGTAGIGKSTVCARLSGTIAGAVLLDVDIFAEEHISVVPPNEDYAAFWRSMMRLAHELAQNDVAVVLFSTMLPEQALTNRDVLRYFDSAHFLCLTCEPDTLGARLARREGSAAMADRIGFWIDFNDALVAAASNTTGATLVDASGTMGETEQTVRHWIGERLNST